MGWHKGAVTFDIPPTEQEGLLLTALLLLLLLLPTTLGNYLLIKTTAGHFPSLGRVPVGENAL